MNDERTFAETIAAMKRLKIAWHRYRFAVAENRMVHHLMRLRELGAKP